MKESFVVISNAALFGVFIIGALLMDALYCHKADDGRGIVLDVGIAFMIALMVRADVRQQFLAGEYKRGWFTWEWQRKATQGEKAA